MENKSKLKPMYGYEDYYSIDIEGNVFRTDVSPIRRLKTLTQRQGYKYINTRTKGKMKAVSIHRAVALTFLKHDPLRYYVNHKDGDKSNNHLNNLEFCTFAENMQHAFKTGLFSSRRGAKNNAAKVNEQDVIKIRELKAGGVTAKKLAVDYSISEDMVYRIIRRDNWTHV